jgi:hypothetical protein
VNESDGKKGQEPKRRNAGKGADRSGREEVDVEHDEIPHRRKSLEPGVLGLHLIVREIHGTRHENDDCRHDPPRERHEIAGEEGVGRYQDISDEVDNQVERRARPAGRCVDDVDAPRDRSVDAIHEKCDGKPQKHRAHIALDDRDEGQKPPDDPACGKEVDRHGKGMAGWRDRFAGRPMFVFRQGTGRTRDRPRWAPS